ncbi:MAG: hypothetical protein ACC649_08470 [Myxococcota bacterium]
MGIVRSVLGPKSQYVKELPFTYEAQIRVVEDLEMTNTIVSDTICRLVEHLLKKGIDPTRVEIREVYPDREKLIDQALYTNAEGRWLTRPDMCRSFQEHYPGHATEGNCTFRDRSAEVIGN